MAVLFTVRFLGVLGIIEVPGMPARGVPYLKISSTLMRILQTIPL